MGNGRVSSVHDVALEIDRRLPEISIEPDWVRRMKEHVAATRDDEEFVPDPPGALDAVIAEH